MTQQPQYQPPQYANYGSGAQYLPPQYQQRTNTMAILSLVFAFVFWPLGIVFGHIGRSQIRRTGEDGSGMALAGLIIGYLALAGTLILIIAMAAAVSSSSTGY